ncbi:MAG: polyprenyl synthetase family protein [Prevotella sp.]|nr:polyprenyl synthetase family protein [Prevotella sp.]
MDYQTVIKAPISAELADFIEMFNRSLDHEDGMLAQALNHIRQRGGKRMRPILILLIAKSFGAVTEVTQHAAIGLELLHTASLVHDDVVDESAERRGQASVNAIYDNKVSVLVGDYILSTALLHVSYTHRERIIRYLAQLGRTLSDGEILQLSNISNRDISEDVYYNIIKGKTAALFEACASIGALASGATDEEIEAAARFGQNLGIVFQIRDDIFDYYDSADIGKPTGNDMAEGKLTLPAIYAVNHDAPAEIRELAYKVKDRSISTDEIGKLVAYTKVNGGIEYAERRMWEFHDEACHFIDTYIHQDDIRQALRAYLDYVIKRNK